MVAILPVHSVRVGMVEDPADYRWSSYGEAVGAGAKGMFFWEERFFLMPKGLRHQDRGTLPD